MDAEAGGQAGQTFENVFSTNDFLIERRPPPEPALKDYFVFTVLLLATVFSTWYVGGFGFSLSLLLILGTHEFGHYWAARKHRVETSLPWFIPAPPMFIAGTFGAFIRIKEPIPDRRALMEIGAWGPIAGFVAAVPVLVVGLSLSVVSIEGGAGQLSFGTCLLLTVLSKLVLGSSPDYVYLHPVAFAGWLGIFFTALNLWPVGQLDGGHIIFALWPRRHPLIAKIFFASLIPLGYWWPGWWMWGVLILLIGFRHPPVPIESISLERRHRFLGYVSIVIFLISFIPIPIDLIQ